MLKQRILTSLMVERAKATGKRYDLPDGPGGVPGFACRVSERGIKTFSLRYRVKGTLRQRRLSCGEYLTTSLADARTKAREAFELARRGIDPAPIEPKDETTCGADRNSVAATAADYVERYLKRNTRRWRDAEQTLARDVLPCWGERPIQDIARRDVLDLIDGIVDRGSPVAANRVLSQVKRFFNWLVQRGVINVNVATGIKPPHKEKPRERRLSEAEIRAVWQAFDRIGYPFGVLGKLLLLTGQRRGEIAGLRWADLDLEAGVLRWDGTATKTGVEHLLPLSGAAVALLRTLPRIDDSPLLFPAGRVGSTNPVSGFSKVLLTVHQLSGTSGWHFHDLRRTCATHMARLGVAPHVCERILNHSGGSTMSVIARTYNTHNYQGEMRQALEAWAADLERIVAGNPAKVVVLRAAV
jgi:integrase